jgi:hypothetical protein
MLNVAGNKRLFVIIFQSKDNNMQRGIYLAAASAVAFGVVMFRKQRSHLKRHNATSCVCDICVLTAQVEQAKSTSKEDLAFMRAQFMFGLDLSDHVHELRYLYRERVLQHLTFFGCELGEAGPLCLEEATVISRFKHPMVFDVYRKHLYTIEELYSGFNAENPQSYFTTKDYRIYKDFAESGTREAFDFNESLARRMHDACISEVSPSISRFNRDTFCLTN